jgi:hypothetical protein
MNTMDDRPDRPPGRSYGVPDRRRRVVGLLTEAFARDELEQGEFERRVERAEQAGTIEELDQVIADFPAEVVRSSEVPAEHGRTPLSAGDLQSQVDRLDGLAAPTRVNILGDQHMTVLPGDARVVRSVSLVGDCSLDLRPLSGESGVFLVKVVAFLGDTKIIVPPGTHVQIRLHNLIGDQKRVRLGAGRLRRLARKLGLGEDEAYSGASTTPPGPTVVVTGLRLIGDTEIVDA